jgi:hypothetical protein
MRNAWREQNERRFIAASADFPRAAVECLKTLRLERMPFMRFTPIVPFDDTLRTVAPAAAKKLSWPAISALVSALLGLLSALTGCNADSNPPEEAQPVETAPAPDNQAAGESTPPNDINSPAPNEPTRSTDLPNMDEAREEGPPPPRGQGDSHNDRFSFRGAGHGPFDLR